MTDTPTTDAALLIDRALTEQERERLLARAVSMNPNLQGAHVADVLSMFEDGDAYLERREAFWTTFLVRHNAELVEERIKPVYEDAGKLIACAVIAAELLEEQSDAWALDLVMRALRKAGIRALAASQDVEVRECPNGHGPMIFYASEPDEIDEGLTSFYECPECSHREDV